MIIQFPSAGDPPLAVHTCWPERARSADRAPSFVVHASGERLAFPSAEAAAFYAEQHDACAVEYPHGGTS